MVLSALEAQDLKGDYFREDKDVSSFCIVRYGDQERRTEVCHGTFQPKWDASFVFEYDEVASDAVFMFFTEDPISGLSDLFGHVVISLTDPERKVPTNAIFMRELVPIIRCDSRVLHLLRDSATNEVTWPDVSPSLSKAFGGDMEKMGVGFGKVAVTKLQCNELADILKSTGAISGEVRDLGDVLDSTQGRLSNMMRGVAKVSPSAAEKVKALNADRRKNPMYPVELSAIAEEEVLGLVGLLAKTSSDRDELHNKTATLDSKLKATEDEKGKKVSTLTGSLQKLKDDLDGETKARTAGDKALAAATAEVAALTAALEAARETAAASASQTASMQAEASKLEETNQFLLRKGLELAGTGASTGFGFGLGFFTGAAAGDSAAVSSFVASKKSGSELGSEYDATAMALRRAAMGASALTQYDAGSSSYSTEDLCGILEENMLGTMKYLKVGSAG